MSKPAKKYDNEVISWLGDQLRGANLDPSHRAAAKVYGRNSLMYNDKGALLDTLKLTDAQNGNADLANKYADLTNKYTTQMDNTDGYSLGQLGGLATGAIGNHPFKSMALGGLALGNLGGLTDGNGFGGQLVGAGLGGAASAFLGGDWSPYTKAMVTLGGGQLGSLFDKLREKKEQEAQMANQRRF